VACEKPVATSEQIGDFSNRNSERGFGMKLFFLLALLSQSTDGWSMSQSRWTFRMIKVCLKLVMKL
jgi:hypothetical protein